MSLCRLKLSNVRSRNDIDAELRLRAAAHQSIRDQRGCLTRESEVRYRVSHVRRGTPVAGEAGARVYPASVCTRDR